MSFLRTPAESPLYAGPAETLGYVPNYAKVFALAPDVYRAWQALGAAVRAGMPELRYELVTVAAARRLRSDYCTVAHAAILRDRFYGDERLRAVLADPRRAGLDPADLAAVEFAETVAADPTAATEADVQALRNAGLSEEDIFHVVLAITIRRFFAGTLAATGAEPDPVYDPLADTVAR
ncbi:MAG TPA: carboxymuconolactone decarboxylase family protein [Mycobacteriales bacterium]|nr:carboxymuconolactone decarboxylase family protein [Mycobacteriales bacterium]